MLAKILGMPMNASAHGSEIDRVILLVHILMLVLFVGWGIFFVLTLVKFRKSKNPTANYHGVKNHISSYLEVAVAVLEVILLIGFSIPLWSKIVVALPDEKSSVVVHVIAEQFAWNIHYPGPDGVFGRTGSQFVDKQSNPVGLDRNDPNSKDDIVTINQLHLPVDKPAIIYLSSKDVMHSFALPVMRVKQDIIPGMSIPTAFTPIKTGNFEIACTQLCGIGHYRMKGYLTVETQADFDKWVQEQSKASSSSGGGDDFWN